MALRPVRFVFSLIPRVCVHLCTGGQDVTLPQLRAETLLGSPFGKERTDVTEGLSRASPTSLCGAGCGRRPSAAPSTSPSLSWWHFLAG